MERAFTSVTVSGDRGLMEEVSRAIAETLQRFDLKVEANATFKDVGRWEQDGGWYLVVEPDPWSQDGGWVLDLEGRVAHRDLGRPNELVVRDVWASLERAQLKPDPTWDQAWGPLPQPEPGPGPDPIER